MKKEKSDLEKWHKEYRKKHPDWKEKREARRWLESINVIDIFGWVR